MFFGPEARFYLAAILSSHPDPSISDPKRALDVFGEDRGIYELNPIAWEIRAAAQNFRWNTQPQEERLAAYEAQQPWTGNLLAFY